MIDVNKLIGRRNGIVKEIIETYVDRSEPNFISFAAERGLMEWERGKNYRSLNIAGGGGLTKIEALLSCCGEIAERYCSSFISESEIIEGSFNALKEQYDLLDPRGIFLFSEKQYEQKNFPFKKFDRSSVVEWIGMYSHKLKKKIFVPAFLVYLPYDNYEKGGCHFPSNSTGLSCAPSLKEAVLKGLLEIIERDAFAIFWLDQLSPPNVDLSDGAFKELKRRFKFSQIGYEVLDITSDFDVPVVATFSFGNSSFGYVASLGLSCSTTYERAITKSLVENAQGRVAVAFHRKTEPDKKYRADFQDVLSFEDHSYVYSTDESLKEKLIFLLQQRQIQEPKEKVNNISSDQLTQMVIEKGYDVLVKELTTPDIEETGLKVVRVVVPGMVYLHGLHPYPFLGSPRIYQPSKIFAWCNKDKITEKEISNFPPHMLG